VSDRWWKPKSVFLDEELTEAEGQRNWALPMTQTVPAYEKPKQWFEQVSEKMGEGIAKVPILPKALEFIAPAFEFIHEHIEQPFAAIITSPWAPDLPWKKGESWSEHKTREYKAWDAPTYVKGLAEFAMPLWWLPYFSWAGAGARALGVGSKAASKIAKSGKMLRVSDKGFLPPPELLDNVLFRAGRLTRAMEHVPIVNKIVKMVGGEGAFISKKEAGRISQLAKAGEIAGGKDALTLAKMELVKLGFLNSMRDGVSRLLVPKLQVLEHATKGGLPRLLAMDARGVVGNIVSKTGKSQYLYDVLEGAIKNKQGYKFLTKEAEKYVDTLTEVVDDIWKMAKQEGLRMPKEKFLHRIVKGKLNPDTGKFEKSEFGSFISKSRIHETMKEGVEQAEKIGSRLEYGLDISESITSTISHYMRQIAKKRFNKALHPLGKTPRAKVLEAMGEEGTELMMMRTAQKMGAGVANPERYSQLIDLEKQITRHYKGKQIIGEDLVQFTKHPSFKNKLFPTEVVKTAEKILGDEGQKWLTTMAQISGTSRMLVAAMDLSAPFIQGLAVAGRNPAAWAGMLKRNLEFFIKPENFYKYMTDPKTMAIASERISAGGSGSTFEFFNALLPLQRGLGKVPTVGKPLKGLVGQTYGRAEAAFSGGGEAARNYMWQAMRHRALNPDGTLNRALAMDLARTIDRMTGVMSTEALAIGRTQQDFENAFVFFAPRYTRAGLSFVSDALRGGMAGAEARKSLAALTAGGASMYYGVCKALGQQPNLNPNSGRFMTIKVGDTHIGIGGIMVALMRFGYDVAATALEDPINLVKPLSEGSVNRWDNPFIRFLYARTAPLTSTLYGTLVEQADYFGEPFESVGDWANFMADKVTPIAVQGVIDDPSIELGVAEFAGLRAFPKSAWELLDEERDDIALREFNDVYDNLNDLEQTRVDKFPTVQRLQKDIDAQTVARGDATSVAWLNWEREKNVAREVYEETLHNLQRAYDDGVITGVQFRERMSDAGYGLGATYEHINKQPEYKEVMETLKKPRKITDRHIKDIASAEFMDRMYRKDEDGRTEFEDKYGLFQYDKYNAYIEEFRAKYGEEIYQYVLEEKRERDENLPPLAKEYQRSKEIMKPYWAIKDRVIKQFGRAFAESSRGQSLITKMRKALRLQNPLIEKYYQMFYAQK